MQTSTEIVSDITVYMKYAKFIPEENRREEWAELVSRNMRMHINKFPSLEREIRDNYKHVFNKQILPSMRSLQFGGRPIELAHNRIYNCCFLPNEHVASFSELMFLLLGGTGAGLSVQKYWIDQLPKVMGPQEESRKFLIGDSIEGWADAVKVLMESYLLGKQSVVFDYRDIREKGAELVTTGGKAPGPEPLKACLELIKTKLDAAVGRQLMSTEIADLDCIIADAVLAGGIRRAALIILFDRYDEEMLRYKTGAWWEEHPYRARANVSAVLPRGQVNREEFQRLMKIVENSGSGEPGVYWTTNEYWGTNPCCEIALQPYQFC